ncbi:hypothetical protein BDR06DRAFT_954852 [Suillus hirtellus]|nr:hypothetical protein BDR06DRAFT_954852 [Suillus hirtellus]
MAHHWKKYMRSSLAIRHPYFTTGALLCISGNPELLLAPLRIAHHMCFLLFEIILWPFKPLIRLILYMVGFRRQGVAKSSYASRYQSHQYGGYVPPQSTISKLQAPGATNGYKDGDKPESMFFVPVSLMANAGTLFVLGRAWGWWCISKPVSSCWGFC